MNNEKHDGAHAFEARVIEAAPYTAKDCDGCATIYYEHMSGAYLVGKTIRLNHAQAVELRDQLNAILT